MAAYSTLVTLSKAIDQILPYEQHYSFLYSKHQMQSLHDKVIRFQVFLEDVSGKSSDGVDELESRIRDVAYRLEDIVEPILVYSLAVEYQIEVNSRLSIQEANAKLPLAAESMDKSRKSFFRGLVNKLCVPCCRSTIKDGSGSAEAHPSLREDSVEMKKILSPGGAMDTKAVLESTAPSTSAEAETETSLDDILGWCLDQDLENNAKYSHLPLTEHVATAFGNSVEEAVFLLEEAMETGKKDIDNKLVISGTSIVPHDIATTSLSRGPPDANDTMVGLEYDLQQILDKINRRERALEVIPITGMGGIGKTTLARAVYDYHGKQAHFDLVLWATVSQQYNVKEMLRLLCPETTESDAIVSVHKMLQGRRYLIILDDVWDEKVCDGVRNAFPNDNNCSRVILTTRLGNVATYASSSSTCAHRMQFLNEERSWDLLRETVYGHGAGCPGEFEDMGRRISGNCKGLPLALVVIGGLLKFNKVRDYWLIVAESTTTKAAADDDSLLRIFSLSYRNLPPQLKACFLYFGMFREDAEIPANELVRLWCAEGFLKPRGSKTMEEVGEVCLEELVERNLVLVMKKKYDGKIKTSSIHDVLRDLSLRQAQTEKFLYCHHGRREIDNDTFRGIIKDQARRVSFPEFNSRRSISFSSPIRTFRTDQRSGNIPEFKLLRVLGVVQFSSSALRNSVGMNNLRYLHLHMEKWADEESITVPKSISKLRNLETLFVSGGDPFSEKYSLILPVEIWEMPRLRHLLVSERVKMQLAPFPGSEDSSKESCSSLQTLTGLYDFDFTPSVIQKLQQNLKKLKINYIYVSDGDDGNEVFVLENLVNLHNLEYLTICREFDSRRVRDIGYPMNLKKLSLKNTKLPWEKMTSIGVLNHLEVLKLSLDAFVGKVWEPIDGGFLQLKYLKMELLWQLGEWRAESTHFPSLEKLLILYCSGLKEVPGEIGDIDTLQKLIVKKWDDNDVGRGFEESVRRIEEESVRVGNDSLEVFILSGGHFLSDVDR